MDKIRIGDTVRFSYNTTPRIYLIVNNRRDIGITTQCVVEDIDDDTAVIHAQSDEEARLVIPTKYLIKVEAEAKEPKYKRGQWVEMPDGDVAVITNVDYKSSHPYSLFSVKKEDLSYGLWSDDDLKPYTESPKSDDEKPQAIRIEKWEQYTADLAKEIAVKMAGNTNFRDAQEKAAYVVKYVRQIVENLKERK